MPKRNQDLPSDPLHALPAGSLGGDARAMVPAMALALDANFGGVGRWRSEFVAMARAPGRDSGRALLSFVPRDGTLVNEWAADHAHSLARGVPILALDLDPHSHRTDSGADASAFVDAFMDNIDWAPVYERYQLAVHDASEPFGATQEELSGAMLLDVRRLAVFEKAETLIPGARWHDPAATGAWVSEIPADREVVVYCVYGHEVGRATAMRLRSQGISARFLRGGIDGWQTAGRPLQSKDTPS